MPITKQLYTVEGLQNRTESGTEEFKNGRSYSVVLYFLLLFLLLCEPENVTG